MGSLGYTAGIAQSSWHRSNQVVRRRAGQPATRVAWYFEPSLLHHLRQATHQRIADRADYQPCGCPFCERLRPDETGTWNQDLAAQHAVYSLAVLTDAVAAPLLDDRSQRVRRVIAAARDRVDTFHLP